MAATSLVRLTPETHARIKAAAASRGIRVGMMTDLLLRDALAERELILFGRAGGTVSMAWDPSTHRLVDFSTS